MSKLPWNNDEVNGKVNQTIGKAKEYIGRNAGDPVLAEEGADQRAQGDAQHGLGKVRRKIGETVSDLGEKLGS